MTNPGKAGSRTPAQVFSDGDVRVAVYRNEYQGRYLFNIVPGRNYMANGVPKLGSSLREADLEPMRVLLAKAAKWIATQPREVQSEGATVPNVASLRKLLRSHGSPPKKGDSNAGK